MLEVMLTTIKETEISDNLSCIVELFENGIGNKVNISKAENGENSVKQKARLFYICIMSVSIEE